MFYVYYQKMKTLILRLLWVLIGSSVAIIFIGIFVSLSSAPTVESQSWSKPQSPEALNSINSIRDNASPKIPIEEVNVPDKSPKPLVGGWYPIFFSEYSPDKVAGLIANIRAGRVDSIQIQYDRNWELAQKLEQEIKMQSSFQVTLSQSSPPDSPSVSYERNRVTVIVRQKNP